MDGEDVDRSPGAGVRRIPAEVWEAGQKARSLLAEAEGSAREIREGAEAEVALARRAAVEAGRAEGFARGRAEAAAELLRGASERDRTLAGVAPALLGLAVALAERILSREVRPGSDAVEMARRAIALLRGEAAVSLRASPGDVEALLREPGATPWPDGCVRVSVDRTLAVGEVLVEADGAVVDGTFRAQLSELRRAMEEGGG